MSLYLPSAFDERDLARLDVLAAAHPFASLVTVDDGEPGISHVPLLYRRDAGRVVLTGHLARPNPQAGHRGRALAVLHGPQAYVSPTWYRDKDELARVPTWNYVVAHLAGPIEWFDDERALAELVGQLSQTHEARIGSDWRFDFDNAAERVQLRGIIGFRIAVDRIGMKAKLSQNHPAANRRSVIDQLDASGDPGGRAVAEWMRASLATSEGT